MTKMNLDEVVEHLRRYLDGQDSVESLTRWYFDEWNRTARLQGAEQVSRPCRAIEAFKPREEETLSEIFLDLDAYEPRAELKAKWTIDEKELRIRLGRHLRTLREIGEGDKIG